MRRWVGLVLCLVAAGCGAERAHKDRVDREWGAPTEGRLDIDPDRHSWSRAEQPAEALADTAGRP